MTRENKERLLAAMDALGQISMGRSPRPGHHSHGGSMSCDYCGSTPGSGQHGAPFWDPAHPPATCPVAVALGLLHVGLPRYEDRAAWLGSEDPFPTLGPGL